MAIHIPMQYNIKTEPIYAAHKSCVMHNKITHCTYMHE